MKNILFNYLAAIVMVLAFVSCSPKQTATSSETGIKWLSYAEAVKLSEKKPKKIFMDVYTDWCGWCKQLDKTTFKDPNVIKYMNEKYYAVKLNAEGNNKVNFKGQEMTEQDFARRILRASAYPTTAYLENTESVLQVIPGFMEADMMNKVLHYFGDNHYKTTTWENYQLGSN